jgi:FtsZ-interacting cell division protein ZipA
MSEVWIAGGIALVGGVVQGMGEEKKDKSDKKFQRELTKDSARYESILSAFENEQDYYYNQLNRANKQRGLEQFRQFSTVKNFAPQYVQSNAGVVVPTKPITPDFSDPAKVNTGGGGKSGVSKLHDTLHPARKLLGF